MSGRAARGWRAEDPIPVRGDTPARPGDPAPIAPLLDKVLAGLGAPPADALAALFERWSDLAGPVLAGHGSPAAIEGGVLVVVVDDPAWATEWRYRQGEVLKRCDEDLGAGVVERVEVRVRRP
jgi:predicted nucleic acid-binding Zn ribbon protein